MAKHKRLKSIGDYLYDKGEMIEQMFSSIPIVEIRNMVPMKLQGMPLHELKAECLVELLGISDREILNIVKGKKERSVSSSDSEHEGAFVISDDEGKTSKRRIKKEKDTVRKIKTERVSSRKGDTSEKLPEPSTSKKKRKSKEIVEVNSKKKKKKPDDDPVRIPSSSRDTPSVPVGKKKKNKKDEKKADPSKNNEDTDIVVLDDDSDKEEKKEQKSLLDLLELEMRARAIRSLLKKEEAVQAQKVLSEYKDEPDDLIPVEIEPPHIELLSDSEGEETADVTVVGMQESTGSEKTKEGISSKEGDDSLQNTEDQDNFSRPLTDLSNDESNSAFVGQENMASCSGRNEIINDDTANVEENSAKSMSSQDVMKGCEENEKLSAINDLDDIQCAPSDVIPAKADELIDSSHITSIPCVSESKLDEDSIDPDGSKISSPDLKKIEPTSFTSNDSENNMDTGHFLVVEEPSMMDGSKNELLDVMKPNVDTAKPDDEFEQSEPCQVVDCLFLDEELKHPPVTNCSEIGLNSKLADDKKNTTGALGPTVEDFADTKGHVAGDRSCSSTNEAKLAVPTPVSCKSTDGIIKEDLDSQYEDEVLDYDYNPVSSCEQMAEASVALSSENNCSEAELDKVECDSHQADNKQFCGFDKPECTFTNTAEDVFLSSGDLSSASIRLQEGKNMPDNCCVTENIADYVPSDDSNNKSSFTADSLSGLMLETSKPEQPEVSRDPELLAPSVGGVCNDVQQNTTYDEDLNLKNDDPHTPPLFKTTRNHDTCGHSLNTQAACVLGKDEFPTNERGIPEVECSEQYQLSETNFVSHHPESNCSSADTEATKNEVLDVSLALEENVSSVDKDQIISGGSCVTESFREDDMHCLMMEQSSTIIHAQKPEKNVSSESLLSSRPDNDANVAVSAVMYKPATIINGDPNISGGNLSPIANQSEPVANDVMKEVQNTYSTLFATGSTVESSNSEIQNSETLDLCEDVDIVDEAIGVQDVKLSKTHSTGKSCELLNSTPQNLINANVAEIIDITDGEQLEGSEVEYVGEEIVDSDSLDVSDHEISGKAASILEQMNTILNEGADGIGDISVGSCQSSTDVACEIPAEIRNVNSGNSELVTDDDSEDNAMPEENRNNSYVDVVDLDDGSEEESSGSKEEGTSDSNDDNSSEGSQKDSIQIIYDSESDSKSNDSVKAMQPETTISDDCIMVTKPECTDYSNSVVLIEPSGSESDDCAIVSLPDDTIAREQVRNCEAAEAEAGSSMTVKSPSMLADKDTVTTRIQEVMATIVIEDDDGEEVQLLTKEVPAEILELDDDDELKSNWTARWLESDNVKKVVKTSKILANVRKQMKMKLKKVEDPIIEDPKPSTEKCAPPLIGSVEEYHRLVKEGVIFSKVPDNTETPESSKASCVDDARKKSTDVLVESTVQVEAEEKSNRKNPEKKKKTERKKKSGRSKSHDRSKKNNSDKSTLDPSVLKSSTHFISKEINALPKLNKKREGSTIAADDTGQEDGEIVESTNSKLSDDIGCLKAETENNGKSANKICFTEQSSKECEGGEELEEGEICDKEEGEISDSDDASKESQNSSQPKSSSSLKVDLKEGNSCVSPLSSIPLPQKPVKQQPTKTPERSSVAKRMILRSLQLGRKKPAKSKNKKKRKKGAGGGNKKGLGYSPKVAPKKNKPAPLPQTKVAYEQPLSLTSTGSSLQAVTDSQPSYLTAYPGLAQPGSISQQSQAHDTNTVASNTAQMYDSYYSWAYSQGLISSASGNYGYGTPESISDPNVYKQWEEYYRKLMEACKVSAEHASASTSYNVPSASTTDKSGYTWVFDHSASAAQPAQIQTVADSTTEPVQVPAASPSSDVSQLSQDVVPVTNEMSDKERFECWKYRYGLKGLLKEHFVPAPGAPSSGDGNQKL